MSIIKKWNSISLILRILIGLVVGAVLGLLLPKLTGIGILGTLFVGALKAIAPVLVFVLVSASIANAKGGNAGKFRTVIFLYLFSTLSQGTDPSRKTRSRTATFPKKALPAY